MISARKRLRLPDCKNGAPSTRKACRSSQHQCALACPSARPASSYAWVSTTPTTRRKPVLKSPKNRSCSANGSCPTGANDPIVLTHQSLKTDGEVELGDIISIQARYISRETALLSHVAGYCVINDVSEREYQWERDGTWDNGKGCDTFVPISPWLVTADEIPDPQNLDLWLEVNGKRLQNGNTRTMVFDVASLIFEISQFTTLYPGDIISTGTPPGVGMGQKPPVYLQPGDEVRLGIAGLGEQTQRVYAWDAALLD